MKITFYGRDFSPIAEAGVKGHSCNEKIGDDYGGLTYLTLLEEFVREYKLSKQGKNAEAEEGNQLYFPPNSTRFGRWVGVFRNKKFIEETTGKEFDITLEIRCRFDKGESEEGNTEESTKGKEKEREKAYFLAAMLLCLPPKDLKRLDMEVNISFDQVMEILLLFMYKNQLAEASKKGIFRRYQRFENNDSRPHGTIDIARHIRENMGLERGRIAYHYRELTADNPVNRLILAAYKRLCEKFPGLCEMHIDSDERLSSTLNMLKTELGWSKANVRSIVKENLRPVTHPYFSEYEDLRRTCLRILRDESVSIFDAEDCFEETDAIYFDITKLWEKYLESQFDRLVARSAFQAQEGDTFLQNLKQGGTSLNKEAVPDFLFQKGGKNVAILDAKFKPDWQDRSPKYLTGDIDECIRNMVVFWTERTGVIYPDNHEEGSHEVFSIIGKKIRPQAPEHLFDVVKVPVPRIKQNEAFSVWSKELDDGVSGILGDYLDKLGIPHQ